MTIELKDGIKAFHAKTRKAWRKWLEKNHDSEKRIWLIIYHKKSKTPSVYYEEAVEEALCFGWIDSKPNKRDDESFYLFLARRKSNSNWSMLNRKRAGKMIESGLMTPAGQAMIDLAKKTGTWIALEEVHDLILPDDLQKLFDKNKTAFKNFDAFPPSTKRGILEWIMNARKPETRQQRIEQTVDLADKNIRANQYIPKRQ